MICLGCGDHTLEEISLLPDPCPLPSAEKKRSLNEKERLIYAPFSGVGGVVYDKVNRSRADDKVCNVDNICVEILSDRWNSLAKIEN